MRPRTLPLLALGFGLAAALSFATPSLLSAGGLLPGASPVTQDGPERGRGEGRSGEHDEHEDSLLHREMKSVKNQLRSLRRSLKDPAQDEASLASLQALQHSLLACKDQVPPRTGHEPEGERGAFVRAYRKEMAATLAKALEVETLLLDGQHEQAAEAFEALRRMEDPAHERFTEGE